MQTLSIAHPPWHLSRGSPERSVDVREEQSKTGWEVSNMAPTTPGPCHTLPRWKKNNNLFHFPKIKKGVRIPWSPVTEQIYNVYTGGDRKTREGQMKEETRRKEDKTELPVYEWNRKKQRRPLDHCKKAHSDLTYFPSLCVDTRTAQLRKHFITTTH